MKGKKRKTREEKYDRDEEAVEAQQVEEASKTAMVEKQTDENGTEEQESDRFELEGIPIAPTDQNPKSGPGVIFILEKASLEIGKVGKVQSCCFCIIFSYFIFELDIWVQQSLKLVFRF